MDAGNPQHGIGFGTYEILISITHNLLPSWQWKPAKVFLFFTGINSKN
jgi:hypothetical protein